MTLKNSNIIIQVKSKLTDIFSMINIEPISFYRGLKVQYNQGKQTIKLLQLAYINKVLSRFHLDKA